MHTLVLSALVLGALTAAAAAEPLTLTNEQMGKVTAGSDISSATRGFAVSSTIHTIPTDSVRGLYVQSFISTIPPNPIKGTGEVD